MERHHLYTELWRVTLAPFPRLGQPVDLAIVWKFGYEDQVRTYERIGQLLQTNKKHNEATDLKQWTEKVLTFVTICFTVRPKRGVPDGLLLSDNEMPSLAFKRSFSSLNVPHSGSFTSQIRMIDRM